VSIRCRIDEHQCRVWWNSHKHYLRVGDAVVRTVVKSLKANPLKPCAPLPTVHVQPRLCQSLLSGIVESSQIPQHLHIFACLAEFWGVRAHV
jgi:hypothetical protein